MRKPAARIAAMAVMVALGSCVASTDERAELGVEVFDVTIDYPGECEARGARSSVLFWESTTETAWIDVGRDGTVDGVRNGSEVIVRWDSTAGPSEKIWYSFDLTNLETVAFARTLNPVARVSPLLDPADHPFGVVRDWQSRGLESPVRLFDDIPDSPVVEWVMSGDEVVQVVSEDPNPEVGFPTSTKLELQRPSDGGQPPPAPPSVSLGEANAGEMLADSQLSADECSGYSPEAVDCRLSEAREFSVENWIMLQGPVGSTDIGGC